MSPPSPPLDSSLTSTQIFSPATPIHQSQNFYGRAEERLRLSEIIKEPGMHATLYGERGIGKTSLANVVLANAASIEIISITCYEKSGFTNLWRSVFNQLHLTLTPAHFSTPPASAPNNNAYLAWQKQMTTLMTEKQRQAFSLDEIVSILTPIPTPLVIMVDEFDLAVKQENLSYLFANLIKTLSDRLPHITLLLVGIANSSHELIAEHPSLERCLAQIMLRRMRQQEMQDFLESCLSQLNLTIDREVMPTLLHLTAGFPYYVHMLGKYAAESAFRYRYTVITKINLKESVEKTIEQTFQSVVTAYKKASQPQLTLPPKAMHLHQSILEAAAQYQPSHDLLTPPTLYDSEEITFTSKSLLPHLSIKAAALALPVDKYQRKIALAFSQLSHPRRGSVFTKLPKPTPSALTTYCFSNPLLKAYVLLKLYLT